MTRIEHLEHLEILKARPVLSKAEYKELSGLSIPTITRLALSGEIPSMKVGGRRLLKNIFCGN